MYSATLCKEEIESTRRFVRSHSNRLYRMLGKAAKQLEVLKEESSSSWQVLENAGTLPVALLSIQGEMDRRHRNSWMESWNFILQCGIS